MNKIEEFQGEFRFLSNFYPSKIFYEGRTFSTVEHAYQSAKTTNIIDIEKIQNAETPGKAKRIGQKVEVRENWEEIKIFIMYSLLRNKFLGYSQSQTELREMLILTKDYVLIEGNTWGDTFWGQIKDIENNWYGENWLGKLLMLIRSEILLKI